MRRKITKINVTNDINSEVLADIQRRFPQITYNGSIQEYEDGLDYVKLTLRGVRLA